MEGGALLSDWWAEVSKDFVPYLNITTHLESSPDQELLQQKGGLGFPTLFFFEPETGAVLNDSLWPHDEETVRAALADATAKAAELKALMRKAEAEPENPVVQAELKLRLAMMQASDATLEELIELAKTPGLDAELKSELDAWIGGRRVQKVFEDAQEKAESQEQFDTLVHDGFYALLKEGVRLPAGHDLAQPYYGMGLDAAVGKKDRAVAEAAFQGLKDTLTAILDDNPQLKTQVEAAIEKAKKQLDTLP